MPVYDLELQRIRCYRWGFLGLEFAEQIHADWPVDRCLDAYLRHQRLSDIVNDRSACHALLERVMANIGPGSREGPLARPECPGRALTVSDHAPDCDAPRDGVCQPSVTP